VSAPSPQVLVPASSMLIIKLLVSKVSKASGFALSCQVVKMNFDAQQVFFNLISQFLYDAINFLKPNYVRVMRLLMFVSFLFLHFAVDIEPAELTTQTPMGGMAALGNKSNKIFSLNCPLELLMQCLPLIVIVMIYQ
jgi:hypothetical protein